MILQKTNLKKLREVLLQPGANDPKPCRLWQDIFVAMHSAKKASKESSRAVTLKALWKDVLSELFRNPSTYFVALSVACELLAKASTHQLEFLLRHEELAGCLCRLETSPDSRHRTIAASFADRLMEKTHHVPSVGTVFVSSLLKSDKDLDGMSFYLHPRGHRARIFSAVVAVASEEMLTLFMDEMCAVFRAPKLLLENLAEAGEDQGLTVDGSSVKTAATAVESARRNVLDLFLTISRSAKCGSILVRVLQELARVALFKPSVCCLLARSCLYRSILTFECRSNTTRRLVLRLARCAMNASTACCMP